MRGYLAGIASHPSALPCRLGFATLRVAVLIRWTELPPRGGSNLPTRVLQLLIVWFGMGWVCLQQTCTRMVLIPIMWRRPMIAPTGVPNLSGPNLSGPSMAGHSPLLWTAMTTVLGTSLHRFLPTSCEESRRPLSPLFFGLNSPSHRAFLITLTRRSPASLRRSSQRSLLSTIGLGFLALRAGPERMLVSQR